MDSGYISEVLRGYQCQLDSLTESCETLLDLCDQWKELVESTSANGMNGTWSPQPERDILFNVANKVYYIFGKLSYCQLGGIMKILCQ